MLTIAPPKLSRKYERKRVERVRIENVKSRVPEFRIPKFFCINFKIESYKPNTLFKIGKLRFSEVSETTYRFFDHCILFLRDYLHPYNPI